MILISITVTKTCPNGWLDLNEVCDDGYKDGYGCKDDCSGPYEGWYCEEGVYCSEICGDGLVVGGEACDDGTLDEKGCLSDCLGHYD